MANRSYLFSCPALLARAGDLPKPIRGISAYNWDIPWVHKVLVSVNPQLCHSAIWSPKIALMADYDGGVARLRSAVESVRAAGNITKQMAPQVSKALAFLSREKSRQNYFLLEAGEIFSERGKNVETYARELLEEVSRINVAGLEKFPAEDAGFDSFWSHVLYFSFPS